MKTDRRSSSGNSYTARESGMQDSVANWNTDMQLRMDSSLIQTTGSRMQTTPLPPDHGWENDDESFAKRLAEHHLTNERGILDTVQKVVRVPSLNPKIHECDVTMKSGQVIKTLWGTDANKAIAKSCVKDTCEAFAYDYSVTADGTLTFKLIRRWLIATF